MSISRTSLLLVATVLLLFVPVNPTFTSDNLVSELISLRSQASTGVIHLSDYLLWRIFTLPVPRPFAFLIVFFDSQQLHNFKNDFQLLSSSFLTNNPDTSNKFFFFDVDFRESKASFAIFGIKSLPHICLVPPSATDPIRDVIQMEDSDSSRLPESIAEFIEANTELTVGPIHRPALVSKKLMMVICALGLILSPFLVKRISAGNTILHSKYMWMVGSIFVYLFSVSGIMYNIINKIPMAMVDRDDTDKGELVFFYDGSGMQLGGEEFAIGFLYAIVGLSFALTTHVLVHVNNRIIQRLMMLLAIFVSFWAIKKVVYLYNWTNGFGY